MIRPSSRFRFLSRATLAFVAAAALAGCKTSGGETLTRDEFLKQGNAICTKGNAEIEAVVPKGNNAGPPSGPEGEAFFKAIIKTSHRMIDDVAALKPPADLQPEMTSIVADSRLILADLEAKGAEAMFALEGDPFFEVNKRLTSIGLTVCGEDQGAE